MLFKCQLMRSELASPQRNCLDAFATSKQEPKVPTASDIIEQKSPVKSPTLSTWRSAEPRAPFVVVISLPTQSLSQWSFNNQHVAAHRRFCGVAASQYAPRFSTDADRSVTNVVLSF
jgi:hypothetical protein